MDCFYMVDGQCRIQEECGHDSYYNKGWVPNCNYLTPDEYGEGTYYPKVPFSVECCPEIYIGNGFCDGTHQPWGCDLTCYDSSVWSNDGGDCP